MKMPSQMKKVVLCVALFLVLVLGVLNLNVFARVCANYSEIGFLEPVRPGGGTFAEGQSTIGGYVVSGAAHLMRAHADFTLLLYRVELWLPGADDNRAILRRASRCLENMAKAMSAYEKLVVLAGVTPYNPEVGNALYRFDYAAFGQAKGLNMPVFQAVEPYLRRGDILGVYRDIYSRLGKISHGLAILRDEIRPGDLPALDVFYRLQQDYFETLLFGQYVAEVFVEIKEKM